MPHSLKARLGNLRYKKIISDKDYDRLCKALEQELKWIPVTERLPEDIDVLVWERHYSYKAEDYVEGCNIGFYWNGSWLVNGGGKFEVLAWMPLPEPYKAESEVEQGLSYADQDTLMPAT